MSRKWFFVFALTVLGIMTFLAYWDEWRTKQENIEKQSVNRIYFAKNHQIQHLVFYHRSDDGKLDPKRFTKVVPGLYSWEIAFPFKRYADGRMINAFLLNLRRYQYEKILTESSINSQDFGVNTSTPDLEISYKLNSGSLATWRIFLGQDAPVGYMIYFSLDSQPEVFIGSKHLGLILKKSPFDLREKRLLMPWLQDLSQLEIIKQSGARIKILRDDQGQGFKSQTESQLPEELIANFKDELGKISISEFLPLETYQSMNEHFSKHQPWLELMLSGEKDDKEIKFSIYLAGAELVGFNRTIREVFKLPISSLRYVDKYFDQIK